MPIQTGYFHEAHRLTGVASVANIIQHFVVGDYERAKYLQVGVENKTGARGTVIVGARIGGDFIPFDCFAVAAQNTPVFGSNAAYYLDVNAQLEVQVTGLNNGDDVRIYLNWRFTFLYEPGS